MPGRSGMDRSIVSWARMKTMFWAFALSAVVIGFIAVYFAASIYFCAGVGEGQYFHCAALISMEMSASSTVRFLVAFCATCLMASYFISPRRAG